MIFHTNAGFPVLASDMLLSVPWPHRHTDLRLPSQPNGITIPLDTVPSYIPVRMRRKIFVVNGHLAVGAAGSASHIAAFIDDLTTSFRDRNLFTNAEIRGFLDRYASSQRGEEILEQISVLLLVEATDWRGSLTKGLSNHRNEDTKRFGRVVTIGSGSDAVFEQVRRLDTNYEFGMSQPTDGDVRFPEFRTLAHNLQLLANIYWMEFVSPANIFEAWGGAYDLIYQDSNGVFNYLNDYTIFLRLLDVDQADKGIQLMNVLKYQRRSEISYIAMLNDGKLDLFGAKDITASDTPVTVTLGREDFSMNSKVHISIIAVGKGGKFMSPMIQIDGLDPTGQVNQLAFTDFDEEGRLRVFFHAQHDDWLKEQSLSLYQRHADSWS